MILVVDMMSLHRALVDLRACGEFNVIVPLKT